LRRAVEKRLVGRRFPKNETQNQKSRNIRRNHNQFFSPRPEQKTTRPEPTKVALAPPPSDFAPFAPIFSRRRDFLKKFSVEQKNFLRFAA